MDPDIVLAELLDALRDMDRSTALDSLDALYEWISKDGYLPDDPR